MKRFPLFKLLFVILFVSVSLDAWAQGFQRVTNADDLFSVGGGARALGMGGAHVALVQDVTAGFWNPAGLSGITNRELAYMHSERFGGIVAYDYGALAMPLRNEGDALAITFFRQGVDGIKNTLNAWDRERDRPLANPQDFITEFSSADMAFLVSYATRYNEQLSWGTSVKLLYSRLGPFAQGFGYSVDVGGQYRSGRFMAGATIHNLTTLMKLWSVNESELEPLRDFFSDEALNASFPTGQNELSLPSLRSGVAYFWDIQDFRVLGAFDMVTHFEGRRTYYVNAGPVSFQPHVGTEVSYKEAVFVRLGVTDVFTDSSSRLYASPTLGAGLNIGIVKIDYAFSSFAGANSNLGYTHRVSANIGF
ncbi:MAG: PorV/PorQ family protein [Balneolales bacterium]|nr:PorV/PorQ family protein [Balneolales bacterium]